MPEYLYTAVDSRGRKVTQRVHAASAEVALAKLQEQGYADIVMHSDDVSSRYARQSEVDSVISPKEFVRLRSLSHFGLWMFSVKKAYLQNWWLHLPVAGWLAYNLVYGVFDRFLDYLLVFVLLHPLVVVTAIHWFGSFRGYEQMIDAVAWGRWEEALDHIPRLKGKVAADELAFREATALAGSGWLDEALDTIAPFSNGKKMPLWLYFSRLPEIYAAAGQREKTIDFLEKAHELAPDQAVVKIDYAGAILRYQHDTAKARELLDQAKSLVLADIAKIFLGVVEGLLALEEKNYDVALERFEQGMNALKALEHASPLIPASMDSIRIYQAFCHGKKGDLETGRRLFHQAEPRMRAIKSFDWITRCREVLDV